MRMILQIIISNGILDLVTGILAKISLGTGIWAKFRLGTGIWYPPSRPSLNYNSFILMVAIIGVGIYSTEAGGYNVFDSHARDMYHNSHSEGTCVLLEIPSMHKLVQYFETLHTPLSSYISSFLHIATFEPHLFSCNVENRSISNVYSYQCSCKQCYPTAVYAMCYSLINPCGYWT